jgi:hypothetical protein
MRDPVITGILAATSIARPEARVTRTRWTPSSARNAGLPGPVYAELA